MTAIPSLASPAALPLDPGAIESWCARLGWRITGPRRAIFQAIHSLTGYFDADTLLARAKVFDPSVARATIYRTLPQLSAAGLLHATEFGDGHHRYCLRDPDAPPTAEIYVVDCGRILKVPAPFLSWYAAAVTNKAGYEVIGHRLQTFARCREHEENPAACEQCTAHAPAASVVGGPAGNPPPQAPPGAA